jgi:hypothetical protein
MKKLIAVVVMFSLECTSFGQIPTDTSMKRTQKDTLRRDTLRKGGAIIIDTVRPNDTIRKKVEEMRPKTKDDLKDTVPQFRR